MSETTDAVRAGYAHVATGDFCAPDTTTQAAPLRGDRRRSASGD
jgi:hypothetical protein